MTLTDLTAALTGAVPNCYPDAAPAGVRPCVVYSVYGSRPVLGDDRNQMDIPKVQLDLLTLSSLDPLLDTVTDVLWELALPYSVQDMSYDPDYGCFRTILQTEVV